MRDPEAATLEAVGELLKGAARVAIGSHVDPDGDAVGSCLGLSLALDAIGVRNQVVLASGDWCPATYAFLPGAERFIHASEAATPDVFVSLDSPRLSRLGEGERLARSADTLVMIDHHPDAIAEGSLSIFDSTAPATGALVWRLLPHLGAVPGVDVATCLYAAVLTDTGRFSYSNTNADTLRIAAEMADAGAHPNDIYTAIYENRSSGAQMIVGRTLGRVTLANGGRVAYSWIDEHDFAETGALPEEAENLIDHVRALGGVDAVFLAKVVGGETRVSLRAKGDTDVGEIARAFGGGGHRAAAGFTFAGDLEALLPALLPVLPGGSR